MEIRTVDAITFVKAAYVIYVYDIPLCFILFFCSNQSISRCKIFGNIIIFVIFVREQLDCCAMTMYSVLKKSGAAASSATKSCIASMIHIILKRLPMS